MEVEMGRGERASTAEQTGGRGIARRMGCTGKSVSSQSHAAQLMVKILAPTAFFFKFATVDVERKRVMGTTVISQSDILVKGIRKRRGHHIYVLSCIPKPNPS